MGWNNIPTIGKKLYFEIILSPLPKLMRSGISLAAL